MARSIAITDKKTGRVIKRVEAGVSYRLPVGYTSDMVKLIPIKGDKDIPVMPITTMEPRKCVKCDSVMSWTATCCSERSQGFLSKWVCPKTECGYTLYSRKK